MTDTYIYKLNVLKGFLSFHIDSKEDGFVVPPCEYNYDTGKFRYLTFEEYFEWYENNIEEIKTLFKTQIATA